ncbi:hypothetical protein BJ6T_39900 [Bradyrhizobium japonicum USDA 6]|nr:hypothetical protein BJ6T_39900 [Bradyrhizobium japonicum USDA 6]
MIEFGQCARPVTLGEVNPATAQLAHAGLRADLDHSVAVGHGTIQVTIADVDEASVDMRLDIVWMDQKSLIIVGDGTDEVASRQVDLRAPYIGVGILGIELDDFGVVRQRGCRLSLSEMRKGPVESGGQIVWIALDDPVVIGDLKVDLAFLAVEHGATDVCHNHALLHDRRRLDQGGTARDPVIDTEISDRVALGGQGHFRAGA